MASQVEQGVVGRTGDERLDAILAEFPEPRGNLVQILHRVQQAYHYLPKEELAKVAAATGFSLQRLYGIATFYNFFSLEPRGEHHVCVCLGTACHVKGAALVLSELEHQLRCKEGETSADGRFSLESVRCIGACSLAPVVTVDKDTHAHVRPRGVKKLVEGYRAPKNGTGLHKARP